MRALQHWSPRHNETFCYSIFQYSSVFTGLYGLSMREYFTFCVNLVLTPLITLVHTQTRQFGGPSPFPCEILGNLQNSQEKIPRNPRNSQRILRVNLYKFLGNSQKLLGKGKKNGDENPGKTLESPRNPGNSPKNCFVLMCTNFPGILRHFWGKNRKTFSDFFGSSREILGTPSNRIFRFFFQNSWDFRYK